MSNPSMDGRCEKTVLLAVAIVSPATQHHLLRPCLSHVHHTRPSFFRPYWSPTEQQPDEKETALSASDPMSKIICVSHISHIRYERTTVYLRGQDA
jgi:hypothetical protein